MKDQNALLEAPDQTVLEPFLDSTPLLAHPEKLRQRAEQDGYLFFRQAIPKEPIAELRRQILAICERHGWVIPGTDGCCDLDAVNRLPKEDLTMHIPPAVYAEVQKLELFHRLPHHPRLIAIYEAIFGEPVLSHPRCIARVVLPHHEVSPTPPHQDFIHIQGTRKFWTCWFPLGDCPIDLGGLAVLKGSHRGGIRSHPEALGLGQLGADICSSELTWVGGKFESGDILTFPCMTVHKAWKNEHPDQIRLSCDNRYQAASQPIEHKSLRSHGNVLPWEEIYRDWKSTEGQYYWKKMDLVLSDWDESVRWQKERICD